jgi:hypothetical protein
MPTRTGKGSSQGAVREIPQASTEPADYTVVEGPHRNSQVNAYELGRQEMVKDGGIRDIENALGRSLMAEEKTTVDRVWGQVMRLMDNGILGTSNGLETEHGKIYGPRISYDIMDGGRNAMVYAYSNDEDGKMARKVDLFKMPMTLSGDTKESSTLRSLKTAGNLTTPDVIAESVNAEIIDAKQNSVFAERMEPVRFQKNPSQIDNAERARQSALLDRQKKSGGDENEGMEIARERNASVLRQRTARG